MFSSLDKIGSCGIVFCFFISENQSLVSTELWCTLRHSKPALLWGFTLKSVCMSTWFTSIHRYTVCSIHWMVGVLETTLDRVSMNFHSQYGIKTAGVATVQ